MHVAEAAPCSRSKGVREARALTRVAGPQIVADASLENSYRFLWRLVRHSSS